MKANGIARLGPGCALALSLNIGQAATLDAPWIGEVVPDPAALSDAAGEWFELHNPGAAPFDPDDITFGDNSSDLQRIETDLLILPDEYLTFARPAAPDYSPGYSYPAFTLGNPGDETFPCNLPGDTLRLDHDRSFAAPGRSPELLASPNLVPAMRGTST